MAISQAEINRLAFKQGVRPEDITSQLQSRGYTAPTTVQEAGVTLPGVQNAPTMSTTPTVPTPTTQTTTSWDVVGKQKDPASVSAYLNTQPGFKTNIVGNTVQGTKNGVQTTWVYDGANWVTKPTIATTETPVIGTPPATSTVTIPGDFDTYEAMTPADRYKKAVAIYMKGGKDITDEEKAFGRYIDFQTKAQKDPFGQKTNASSGTTTYSTELVQPGENIASSVRNSDGTYKVTYKDGTTQITTSEPSTTVFPEGTPEYFAQKQAQEANKRLQVLEEQLNTGAERRKKETADLVAKYGENIATQFQSQKAEIEANGAKRMETLNTGLSFSGFGRSTLALEKRDEIAKNIEATINQAKAKADLELMAYRMEREGADEVAIASMRKNIADVQAQIDDANYQNQLEIIKLNQENATTGAEAMNNLLSVLSNSDELMKDIDFEKSAELGYLIDKKTGKAIFNEAGNALEFKRTTSGLSPDRIQTFSDLMVKGGVDVEGLKKLGLTTAEIADITKDAQVRSGTYEGFGPIDVPRDVNGTTDNVGQDTNNPGNIMADSESQKNYAKSLGAIGFYSSPNGRTYAVFPDMNTGFQAMVRDVQGKINGTSTWANANTTLAKFATGWVSGPNAPANSSAIAAYVKATGYPANTPIGQIPIEKLTEAIIKHEGVDINRSATIPFTGGTGGGQTGTPSGGLSPDTQQYIKNGTELRYIPKEDRQRVLTEMQLYGQNTPKTQEIEYNLELVDEVLNNPNLDKIVGNIQGRTPGMFLGGDVQYLLNQFEQLKNLITLDARQKLKGSGAISDFESKLLASSASALGRNLDETAVRLELQKIKDAFSGKYKYYTGDINQYMAEKNTQTTMNQSGTVGGEATVTNTNLIDSLR